MENQERDGQVLLKAGMFARVKLPVAEERVATLIPKDAVVLGGPSPVVFVVDPSTSDPSKGTARLVEVALRSAEGNMFQIASGIDEGERVVVMGNERLRSGQPVEVIEMKPTAATATPAPNQ